MRSYKLEQKQHEGGYVELIREGKHIGWVSGSRDAMFSCSADMKWVNLYAIPIHENAFVQVKIIGDA